MKKIGAAGMYSILLAFLIGLLVLGSLLSIFREFWSGDIGEEEVCRQSVQLRALIPDLKNQGFNIGEFKARFPLKCKTSVIEITESDVRDMEQAQHKIAKAMVNCWSIYGKGDLNIFPSRFFKSSICVPCARIHLTDDAKEYMRLENGGVDINIADALNLEMDEGLTYYFYLENSGKSFPALNFGSAIEFDLRGLEFDVGSGSTGGNLVSMRIGGEDEGLYDSFNIAIEEAGLSDDVFRDDINSRLKIAVEEITEVVDNIDTYEFKGGEYYDSKMKLISESLRDGNVVTMIGKWDLREIKDYSFRDLQGKIILEGAITGLNIPFAEGIGDGLELEIRGSSNEALTYIGKGMLGGKITVGCESNLNSIAKDMSGGEVVVDSSDVFSIAVGMSGGKVIIDSSNVSNVGDRMIDGRIDFDSSNIGNIGDVMSGGEIWIDEKSVISGDIGMGMSGGKIFVEEGVEVSCLAGSCGKITSAEKMKSCPCFSNEGLDAGYVKFIDGDLKRGEIESFSGTCKFGGNVDSEFCKGKHYAKKCEAIENYAKSLDEDIVVKMKEDGDRDWIVSLRIIDKDSGAGEVELINLLSGAKINVDASTTKISLPEKLVADDGDLLISYGAVVTDDHNFGKHIPYLFYFQSDQDNNPYYEVKYDFIESGLFYFENIENFVEKRPLSDSSSFCSYWEGIPA